MAAGPKLDGAGNVKLATLEEALYKLQAVHALVERMAVEVKSNKPLGGMTQQLKRIAKPIQSMLKAQFQLISDVLTSMIVIAGRGGPDKLKVRAFREQVAQIRTQIEISMAQTKEKHLVRDEEEH